MCGVGSNQFLSSWWLPYDTLGMSDKVSCTMFMHCRLQAAAEAGPGGVLPVQGATAAAGEGVESVAGPGAGTAISGGPQAAVPLQAPVPVPASASAWAAWQVGTALAGYRPVS